MIANNKASWLFGALFLSDRDVSSGFITPKMLARVVRKSTFCYAAQHPRLCRFIMVRCHLSTLMGRDKLRISDVSRLTGLNRSTVTSLYKETVTRVDVAAIDALCNLFRCSVGELFEHVPDADGSLA